ncbi:hypothetical protein GOBAR_AA33563 [Gossypium barbadense]|uniref:Uncharacterized protein n=1 Tax=Gossypium barbadense TaxID=3634 RepID=A0A2P5W7R8_GOSBA|nr:hypothetical protein GOBAR_AA33563 [Gossypium barbadense]
MLHCGSRIAKLFRSPGLNTSDEESDEFLPWLERKAWTKISSMLWIGKSAYGRDGVQIVVIHVILKQ